MPSTTPDLRMRSWRRPSRAGGSGCESCVPWRSGVDRLPFDLPEGLPSVRRSGFAFLLRAGVSGPDRFEIFTRRRTRGLGTEQKVKPRGFQGVDRRHRRGPPPRLSARAGPARLSPTSRAERRGCPVRGQQGLLRYPRHRVGLDARRVPSRGMVERSRSIAAAETSTEEGEGG